MNSNNGGPFGALVVKNGKILAEAFNEVTSSNDPTAHAEILAIRRACEELNSFQLDGCTIYASCEPCPMCLGAIYWARPERVVYACSRNDAKSIGFDDDFIYRELELPVHRRSIVFEQKFSDDGLAVLSHWIEKEDKTEY